RHACGLNEDAARLREGLIDVPQRTGAAGPGVYDIHSPRVPTEGEMSTLLSKARERLTDEQVWVNPDCGLKTRKWENVEPALINMVVAARALRGASNAH
ncbi:MAG TPA: hypothetical protein PLS69_01440, partial [Terricaulis sp.]|nr:hypothetical protein [Terricaulis sp.]